jgi:hypothetical protein
MVALLIGIGVGFVISNIRLRSRSEVIHSAPHQSIAADSSQSLSAVERGYMRDGEPTSISIEEEEYVEEVNYLKRHGLEFDSRRWLD